MEYTIYSETLVNYVLSNGDKYLDDNDQLSTYDMFKAKVFKSLEEAKAEAEKNGYQVRKVKMIDIGGVVK